MLAECPDENAARVVTAGPGHARSSGAQAGAFRVTKSRRSRTASSSTSGSSSAPKAASEARLTAAEEHTFGPPVAITRPRVTPSHPTQSDTAPSTTTQGDVMGRGNDSVARTVLPIPARQHVGVTTYDAKDPDTSFPPIERLRPPGGAPNILVILVDDAGFGSASAFGGPCATPTAERLAANGLRFNRFHTTALCS